MTSPSDKIFDLLVFNKDDFVSINNIVKKYPELSYSTIRSTCLDLPNQYDNVYVFNTCVSYGSELVYPLIMIYTTNHTKAECSKMLQHSSYGSCDTESYRIVSNSVNDDGMRYYKHLNNPTNDDCVNYIKMILRFQKDMPYSTFISTRINGKSENPIELLIKTEFETKLSKQNYVETLSLLFNRYANDIVSDSRQYQYLALEHNDTKFLMRFNVTKMARLEEENKYLKNIVKKIHESTQCVVL